MIRLGKELQVEYEIKSGEINGNQYQINCNSDKLYAYYRILGGGSSDRLILGCLFGYRIGYTKFLLNTHILRILKHWVYL
jgi:hypothetical protein